MCCDLNINFPYNKSQNSISPCLCAISTSCVQVFTTHKVLWTAGPTICGTAVCVLCPYVSNWKDCTLPICFCTNVTNTSCTTFLHLAKEAIVF